MQKQVIWVAIGILVAAAVVGGVLLLREGKLPEIVAPGGGGVRDAHLSAMDVLPDTASLLATIDAAGLTEQAFTEMGKVIGSQGKDEETRTEMGAFLVSRVGVDLLKARTVTVFMIGNDDGGVLLTGEVGLVTTEGDKEQYEGVTLSRVADVGWAARVGERTVMGEHDVVRAVIDCTLGRRVTLAKSTDGEIHRQLAGNMHDGQLVVTVTGGAYQDDLSRALPGVQVDGLGYALDLQKGATLVLKAPEQSRKALLAKLEEGKTLARLAVGQARGRIDRMDAVEGLGVIYANRHLEDLFRTFAPAEDGEFLRLDMTGPEGASIMAGAAVISVTAIPAFIKYMRKAKTAEAIDMLDKIYKGAADYYATPRVSEETAEKLPCQFPEDQLPTPPERTCCGGLGGPDADGDDRCDPDPDAWSTATWSALKFQITDSHYCVYSFDSNGRTGSDAQFTANAHCDLDCDGTWSTFQRYGKGDPRAMAGECAVVSAAALFTMNETE